MLDVRLMDGAKMPERAHDTDAGLDMCALTGAALPYKQRVLVDTGVQVRIPVGFVGLLMPRSSLSKEYIVMTNSCGVIDSDYRGNIMASLMYIGAEDCSYIAPGQKIVQLLLVPVLLDKCWQVFEEDDQWTNTVRGTGGFGSTGA